MIDFSKVDRMEIPEGTVLEMMDKDRKTLYTHLKERYVSFGDSIAAGHAINDDWSKDYGERSQYGVNGNKSTVIIPGTYTAQIRDAMRATYGNAKVLATSFARSGDKVSDLMSKLIKPEVINALKKATVVTVCIGANDILGHVSTDALNDYIDRGQDALKDLAVPIQNSLNALKNGGYRALLDKLYGINPSANYVFTTVYNPYKYLYLDEGNDGFFAPLLAHIDYVASDMIANTIKDALLKTSAITTLFGRVNGLSPWIESRINDLNDIIKSTVDAYPNGNFFIADTKQLFDCIPDRPVSNQIHYNDLVHVEYTRGLNTVTMDWGELWRRDYPGLDDDEAAWKYWTAIVAKYGLDLAGLGTDLVYQTVTKVIIPDLDPHPKTGLGHYALFRSFADVLANEIGASKLNRYTLTYHANNGSGQVKTKEYCMFDCYPAYTTIDGNRFTPAEGYYAISGWKDGGGNAYDPYSLVGLTSSLDLYAQWSNECTINVRNTGSNVLSSETGNIENRGIYIYRNNRWEKLAISYELGTFGDGYKSVKLPYGTRLCVCVWPYNKATATWPNGSDTGNIYRIYHKHWESYASALGISGLFDDISESDSRAKLSFAGAQKIASSTSNADDGVYMDIEIKGNVDIDFHFTRYIGANVINAEYRLPWVGTLVVGATAPNGLQIWDCNVSGNAKYITVGATNSAGFGKF